MDVVIQIAVLHGGVRSPDPGQQQLAGHGLAGVAEEELQKLALPLGEGAGGAGAPEGAELGVQLQVPHRKAPGALPLDGAAGEGADACQQLLGGEGLGQVVVGPGVQAVHAVGYAVQGGDHQDGGGEPLFPQPGHHADPIQPGQHPVQQNEVIGVLEGEVEPVVPGVGKVHDMALLLQMNIDGGAEVHVVFYH